MKEQEKREKILVICTPSWYEGWVTGTHILRKSTKVEIFNKISNSQAFDCNLKTSLQLANLPCSTDIKMESNTFTASVRDFHFCRGY